MFTSYVGIAGSTITPTISHGSGLNAASGFLFANSQQTFASIIDGSSNTIMVGEQSDHLRDANNQPITVGFGAITSQGPHGWTMGVGNVNVGTAYGDRTFNCTTIRWSINQRGLGDNAGNGTNNNTGANIPLSSAHTGGCMAAMGDGSVRFLSSSIPLLTLQQLAAGNDGSSPSIN